MKIFRLLLSFTFCIISIFAMSATGNNKGNAVSMISYEQNWNDYEGTLALKNNTNEEIHNVTFRVTYLNMDDTPINYEDFAMEVNILPGMTKEINIPAYKKGKKYSYFESEDLYSSKKFKIKYETIGYNTNTPYNKKTKSNNPFSNQEYTTSYNSDEDSSIVALMLLLDHMTQTQSVSDDAFTSGYVYDSKLEGWGESKYDEEILFNSDIDIWKDLRKKNESEAIGWCILIIVLIFIGFIITITLAKSK